MWKKVRSQWKTYDEMDPLEQIDLRRFNEMFQRRCRIINGRKVWQYLVDTYEEEKDKEQ